MEIKLLKYMRLQLQSNESDFNEDYMGNIKVNYHRQSRWLWFAINGLPQTAASRVATPPIVISKCRPLCGLHSPYKTFLRYFGINTMWYVQSHFVCAELSSCIFVSCVLSEMRCYRFSTLPQETFSCLITIRVKRFAAP